ncbi:unnamed protein product, partial [Larinioides sclopetarius]
MNWLTTFAFAVLLLSVQYDAVESASPNFSRSPWANPAKANSLMNCLITKIGSSNVLPQQEKEDLESIMDTLMSAIKGASAKGKSSGAQLKAINMAVASSLAEIVVAEDVGNQASMIVKTQALSGALEQCFQAVMGTVDRKFISEINDLISMFARQAATEANEIQDQGAFYDSSSSAISSFEGTSQTYQGSSQNTGGFSTYPGEAFTGPQVSQPAHIGVRTQVSQPATAGYSGGVGSFDGGAQFAGLTGQVVFSQTNAADSALISRIANALVNTSTLRAVFRSGVSQQTISNVVQRTVQSLASNLGIDGNNLSRIALQAISQVPAGSDTSAYAQAFSTALVTGGVLNSGNVNTLGSQVLSAVVNGVSSAAQGLGINVDTGSVQSDIRSSTGFLSTSSSSAISSQTTAAPSTTSLTGAGGYTGGYPGGAGGYTGGAVSVTGQTSFGQASGFTSSAGTLGAFVQTTGADSALISRIANALVNTSTLRAVFRSGVSQQTISNVVQRTVQSLASNLGIDGNNLSRIALQAISQVPAGSDTSAYAQAFSTALVTGGVLNSGNVNTLGSQVLSAVVNGVSSAAKGLGINVDTGSVQSDIRSSTGLLSTSSSSAISSQTTADASTTSLTGAGGYTGGAGDYPGGAGGYTGGAGSVTGQTSFGQASGFTSTAGTQGAFGQTTRADSALISRIANALVNTSTLRAVFRSGVSQQTISNVVQRTVQSLASKLSIDGNNLSRIAIQAISQVPAGSDTSAYAQAFSTALVTGGVLNSGNVNTLGSQVLSAVVNGVSSAAQGLGINVDTGSVQSDIRSSTGFLSTSSSSAISSQTTVAASTTGFTGAGGYLGGAGDYPGGAGGYTGGAGGYPGGAGGYTGGAGSVTGQTSSGQTTGADSALISRIANALANTSTLRAVFRSGVSQQTMSNVVQRTVQALASNLGIDGNNLSRIALQAISQVPAGSDTSAYAQAFSTALVTGGVLNSGNVNTLGSQVLSAVVNGVSSAAQGFGINVDTGSVQSDIRSSTGFLSTSSSSAISSQTTAAASTTGFTGAVGYLGGAGDYPRGAGGYPGGAGGYPGGAGGYPGGAGGYPGGAGGYPGGAGGYTGGAGSVTGQTSSGQTTGADSALISRIANALANTSTLRAVFRSGVSQQTMSNVVQRTVQSLASNLGIDGNNLSRIALQAISQVPAGSDTSAYAQAFSTALVTGGVLNSGNVNTLGSQVLSAVVNGVSSAAQGFGINVDTGSVQSDIRSSTGFLSTSSSSAISSKTTAAASTTGFTGAGGYLGGAGDYPVGAGGYLGGAGGYTGGAGSVTGQTSSGQTTGADSALITRIANALANTSTLRAVFRSGVSQQTMSKVVQRTVQALASNLGIDGNNLSRIALQAISQVPAGSDTSAYAQAFSTALVTGGVLNSGNVNTLGSQVLSAVVNGVSSAAQGFGINVDTGSVQSDIRSSTGFLSTSSSSAISSQTTAAASTTGFTGAGGYLGGAGDYPRGAGGYPGGAGGYPGGAGGYTGGAGSVTGQTSSGQTTGADSALISRIANALANTSTLRAVFRSGVSQQTMSNVVQRTVQALASNLGIDGNNLSRIALQAISQVPAGSDTSAYAQAFSTALVTGGVLNSGNVNTLGSQVLSAVVNGVSSAAQGFGINVDTFSVQSDIRSSTGFLSTSSSSAISSQTTAAASTTGFTGAGGYLGGAGDYPGGAGGYTGGAGGYPGGAGGYTGGAGSVTGQTSSGQTTGADSALISRIANALANTSTLRAVFRSGVSQQTMSNVVQRTVQALASNLGIDGNNLSRIALQAISQVPAGSDTSAYAQAFSTALVTGGVLNSGNVNTLGSQVLSAVVNGVSSAAQGFGINVDTGSVQSDIRSSTGFLSTSSSSAISSQTTAAASTTGFTGAGGYLGGAGDYPGGAGGYPGGAGGYPGGAGGYTGGAGSVTGQTSSGQTTGADSALISRIANALANTSTLRAVFRSGVSQQTMSNVVQRTVQALASNLGIDGNNLSRIALQAISQVPAGSDTSAYAQAFSTALVTGGVLNSGNVNTLGSQVLSAVVNGVSSAAQGFGINVDTGSVQSDIRSSTGFLSTSSSSAISSQTTAAASTTGFTGAGGYLGGAGDYPVGAGGYTGGAGGYPGGAGGYTGGAGSVTGQTSSGQTTGADSALISRIANALANTSTLRAVFRSGVSQQTMSNVVQRTVQALASNLGIDGNNLSRIALQAISQVPAGSDTSAYAQAFSTALVTGGVLNSGNVNTLGSQVLSAVVNGVSSAAQGFGINVDTGSVQSDIRSSTGFLSTSSSSAISSQTTAAASTTGFTGAGGYLGGAGDYPGGAGGYPGGAGGYPGGAGGYPGGDGGYTGGAGSVTGQTSSVQTTGADSALISRIANALANTSTLRAVFRSGVSQQTMSNVVQRTVQSLASNLGIDGNNLSRIALQAISQVPAGSDTSAYAQAFSTALVTGGVLNSGNVNKFGSQVLSAVVNGVSSAAQGFGINVDTGSVQSDIRSSTGFLSTSSSSAISSQTTAAASTTGFTGGGSYLGGAGDYPVGGGDYPGGAGGYTGGAGSFTGQTSSGQTTGADSALISRIANALANTSTLRAVFRSGVSQQTMSNVVQRTVQALASNLGIDGNNLSRIALQAISQVPAGSDTSAYAQAFSTALVTSGVLNSGNVNTLGSQVLSAVVNGVSSAAQGFGINVDTGRVQSDIRSSTGFLSTSSSSAISSQTTAAASTTGFTGAGGYPGGAGGYLVGAGGYPGGAGGYPGGAGGNIGGGGSVTGQLSSGQTTGVDSVLISRIANALANTSTLRAVFRSGVSQQTMSNVVQRTVQSLASNIGIDGNNLSRIALQAISQVPAGSDTSAYAQAFSTALVTAGVLNLGNVNTLGSQVLSAVLNGVSYAAQGLGINVDTGSVQSDIRSSTGFLSTSSSSAISSQTTAAASTTGFTGAGGYTGRAGSVTGQTSFDEASGLTSSVAGQADFSQGSGFASSSASQGTFGQTDGALSSGSGLSAGLSVRSTLNSPNGLRSGSATARIGQLTSSIRNAIGSNGVDANGLARSLQSSFSSLRSSGMSSSDAKLEVLLETIVGLLQLLSNTEIRGVNMATASSVANSAARSFELVLA